MELTFGEQIKIILKRKNMTIRQLAELVEMQTGRPMSRQNLTQKLNRDNFQEQDMREIAQALGCLVQISVIDPMEATVASLQTLMPPKAPQVPEDTMVLPAETKRRVMAVGRTAAADVPLPEEDLPVEEPAPEEEHEEELLSPVGPELADTEGDVDSDVLKEIEMALMESIQKELYKEEQDGGRQLEDEAPDAGREEEPEEEGLSTDQEGEPEGCWPEEEGLSAVQEEEPEGYWPEEEGLSAVQEGEPEGHWPEEDLSAGQAQETPAEYGQPESGSGWTGGEDRREPRSMRREAVRPGRESLFRTGKRTWPKLFVPGEEAPAQEHTEEPLPFQESPLTEEEDLEPVDLDQEELTEHEVRQQVSGEAEEEEIPDLEFFELEELSGGDISGVSAPYVMKRQETEAEEPEEEEPAPGPDAASVSQMPGGDVSYASAPYVIPREPENEPEEPQKDFYVEIPLDELPRQEVDDAADTVRDFGARSELDMEEKLASWDAAVKRRLEQPILTPPEERRAKRAAREAGESRETEENAEGERIPDINPLTGEEYETNTVKHHPTKPDTLLVYDRDEHMWIEQAERAFNNFQVRKRAMLGRDYEPPVYLD